MNHNTKSHQDDNFKDVFSRIGSLARLLRDSMINLGLDRAIMEAAEAIPDARDRLNYVVGKTSQAADRVLTCVETARPFQDRLTQYAQPLDQRWDDWFAAPVDASVAQQLVIDTRQFIKEVPQIACQTNEQLMEIMMAQDFQDLTGQVIKRMMALIGDIEKELIQVLVENMPEKLPAAESVKDSLKNGPPINMHEAGVVASQDQVDDLLESLGF